MRKLACWKTCLALALIVTPLLLASPWTEQKVFGLAVQDDELVLLESNGRISVVDPTVAAGYEPVSWQSDSTGWDDVAVGDFNGDGDDEVLARQDNKAQIFDPVVQPGQAAVAGQWTISSPYVFYDMATGDIDGDGRDEIVLLRDDNAPGNILSRVLVYDSNATGTTWSLQKDLGHGSAWLDVDVDDVSGDGKADLALIRNGPKGYKDRLILILNPSSDYSVLHQSGYSFDWILLRLINTHKVSTADRVEIVTSRSDVLGTLPSVLVFRWSSGTSLEDVWGGSFYPYFDDVEGADLNGDGDEEIVMYRNSSAVDVTLVTRNIAGASMRTFEPTGTNSPHGGWLDLEAGDLEGDGRDEVILVTGNRYRVYDRPETDDRYTDEYGSYRGPFAVGNLDGAGVTAGPTLGVMPASLTFSFEGVIPPAQALSVTNVGQGAQFGWTASVTQGSSWLRISPSSGTTPSTISVAVDPTLLASGTHQGQIRVEAAAGVKASPQLINVTLSVVVTLPRLGVSPASLSFEMDQGRTNPAPQSLTIQNLGGGTPLRWSASFDAPWLEITPQSGSTPTTAWVEVHGELLPPGTHQTQLVIDAGSVIASPLSVPVTLVVNPPVMLLSPATITLNSACSTTIRSSSISIAQQGGGSDIGWTAVAVVPGEGGFDALLQELGKATPEVTAQGVSLGDTLLPAAGWITITPDTGTTPATPQVQIDPSGLEPGEHVATVVVVGWPEAVSDRVQGVDVILFVPDTCVNFPLLAR